MNFRAFFFSRLRKLSGFDWICVEILILGAIFRVYHYAQFPVFGETRDEVAWTMLGASLIQTRQPQSWSYFSPYTNTRSVVLHDAEYRLVNPVVDHPPLFALLPGLATTLRGAPWDSLPSVKAIRAPVVLLSVFNLGIFILVTRRWLGNSVASATAMMLFASVPSWVLVQRLAISENLLLTWILLLLLAVTRTRNRWATWIGVLSLWALPFTKLSGLAVSAAIVVTQNKKVWWFAALAGVLTVAGYFAAINWSLFWQVQMVQASRDTGLLTFFSTQIWSSNIVEQLFADPWIVLGFVATLAVITVSQFERLGFQVNNAAWNTFRSIFLAQIAFLLLSVGEHTIHGWYRIVFFPFFALSLGAIGGILWRSRSLWGLSVVWILVALTVRQGLWFAWGPTLYEWQSLINKIWLTGAGSLVGGDLWLTPHRKRALFVIASLVLVGIMLLSSVSTFWNITAERYWKDNQYLETGLRT